MPKPNVLPPASFAPGPDWMTTYLHAGPPAPSFHDHAAQLEYLIRLLQPSAPGVRAQAIKNLRRYIYFQCIPKIKERLFASVPGLGGQTFESVFRQLSSSKITKGWRPPTSDLPEKIENCDETWLINAILREHGEGATIDKIPQVHPNGVVRIQPEDKPAGITYFFLQDSLMSIRTCIDDIERMKEEPEEEANVLVPKMELLLDKLSRKMETLYLLTHHSRLLWYVIESSIVKGKFTSPPRTGRGIATAGENEGADDINEDHRPFGQDSHTGKVQMWLKGLCHWHRASLDLGTTGNVTRFLAPRTLQINVVEVTPIAEPTIQASLSETLAELEPHNRGFQRTARQVLRNQMQYAVKRKGGPAKVLSDTDGGDGRWATEFWGRVHCEASLACGEDQELIKEIGVSKRCCFCCAVFLTALDPRLKYTGSHDKVYPWAPPANPPPEAKNVVLKALQNRLNDHIRLSRQSSDSGPGSDDDADRGGEAAPLESKMPADITL
ncbi:hypothetical protein FRB94_012024 [Tulasnella sp. JGI-2019a]|nr:hypothetical protein FRB93_010432 [Tulasnella sp. JGI-2019a]KAG8992082.1 hypothetical protein FRB94_012024 [Tulasnella sp. JGI-2019a]KAG9024177.1 hypothetical protein FRB95_011973 [Tulasnella sp. JGI-2019a]